METNYEEKSENVLNPVLIVLVGQMNTNNKYNIDEMMLNYQISLKHNDNLCVCHTDSKTLVCFFIIRFAFYSLAKFGRLVIISLSVIWKENVNIRYLKVHLYYSQLLNCFKL